ncbi:hypothetical protein EN856_39795, partial [Mesorhizobium sp. M8A.F.Ca.ET.213.01.1.1]
RWSRCCTTAAPRFWSKASSRLRICASRWTAADSEAVVVEYRNRAVIKGGTEYTNSNIAVFRFENGFIAAYHDYFDPRRFQVVVDALAKG